MQPKTDGILESSLYVGDLARSVRFYQETFGFGVISEFGDRGCAMNAGARQVLLLFKKGVRARPPHLTMGTANYIWLSPSLPLNLATGKHGLQRKELR